MKYPDVAFEPFFTWSNRPRILYGPGCRSEVGFEMGQLGAGKVLLITDRGLVDAGVAGMVADEIRNSDVELAGIFDDIVQDARIDRINAGAEAYRQAGADGMVVVGGGSVMDTAKAINILIGDGLDDFQPLAEQAALWDTAHPLPPHLVFPTTAGTGSEVTNAMVVLDTEAHAKMAVTHPYNANLAMLDPELTVKLPPRITAFTGMDALTHAIEGVTSTSAEPIGDALGLHAIRLIFRHLPVAVADPENIDSRGGMLIASTLAGMCFGNTMCGGVHAIAHTLGGRFGIPHGLANSMVLPQVMAFNVEEAPERYLMVADAMGIDVNGMSPIEAGREAVEAVRRLKAEIGLTDTLKDFGVTDDPDMLDELAGQSAGDSQISYNPRYLEEEDIKQLILSAL